MIRIIEVSTKYTLKIIAICFTFLPEATFTYFKVIDALSSEMNVILERILMALIVLLAVMLFIKYRNSVEIKGHNYSIKVEYGDLFKMNKCKKVIAFDECFTTKVGGDPADINPDSICGQYLKMNPIQDMKSLLVQAGMEPAERKSEYQSKERYDSGQVVRNGEYLLMAFAKLNKDGLGQMTRDEFLDCLLILWKEIDKYYAQQDVCIPILGSGITRIKNSELTQQELLDIIVN